MEEPSALSPIEETQQPRMSLWQRLANVFATPGEVFEEVAASKPNVQNWLIPVLLSGVIGVVFVLVAFSQPSILQKIQEQQEQQFDKLVAEKKMTAEQKNAAIASMEKIGPTIFKITGSAGALFGGFAWLFFIALVLMLLGKWVFGASFPYMKAVEVVGLSYMISALGAIVQLCLVLLTGNMLVTLGSSLFLSEFSATNKTHLMLSSINLMTWWYIVVLGIGLSKLAGTSAVRASLWLFGLWIGLRLIVVFSGLASSGM